ncbi:hypothetical protein [Rhodococcus erythropolis]
MGWSNLQPKAGTVNSVHPRVDEIIQRVINEERIARRKAGDDIELTDEVAQSEIVAATHQLAKAVEMLSEM